MKAENIGPSFSVPYPSESLRFTLTIVSARICRRKRDNSDQLLIRTNMAGIGCIDLFTEYTREVNGVWRGSTSLKELGTGLVDAMREHGLDPISTVK